MMCEADSSSTPGKLRMPRSRGRVFLGRSTILIYPAFPHHLVDHLRRHEQCVSLDHHLESVADSLCSQVSLLTCDLGVVLEIAGGLSATALAFIVSHSGLLGGMKANS